MRRVWRKWNLGLRRSGIVAVGHRLWLDTLSYRPREGKPNAGI